MRVIRRTEQQIFNIGLMLLHPAEFALLFAPRSQCFVLVASVILLVPPRPYSIPRRIANQQLHEPMIKLKLIL